MALKLKTPPASEPVSLIEAKNYLRISDTDDDALVGAMIAAVRQRCEAFTNRALMTQTWTLWLDGFPRAREGGEVPRFIEIPKPPLQTVSFLKTYDTAGNAETVAASNYIVDAASEPGRLALARASSWAFADPREVNSVEAEFVAGYGDAAAVPPPLKQGMLLLIKTLFADKAKLFETDESQGLAEWNRFPIPLAVRHLWEPYRILPL